MKKTFTSIVALALAVAGFTASATTISPDASSEAKPAKAAVEAPAAVSPAVSVATNAVVPVAIMEHLTLHFPGATVQGISREGLTYVVDLGNDQHIRYDNAYNPICYGDHSHDADYHNYKKP